jgi:hypothetical protein
MQFQPLNLLQRFLGDTLQAPYIPTVTPHHAFDLFLTLGPLAPDGWTRLA